MTSLSDLKKYFRTLIKPVPGGPAVGTVGANRAAGALGALDALAEQVYDVAGNSLTELTLPQAVQAQYRYLTDTGIWEATHDFNAAAAPVAGPNWRLVAGFQGQATSLNSSNISDATAAGRAMLTAADAAAQRALLNNPAILAGAYGNHPGWTSTDDAKRGLYKWLIEGVLAAQAVAKPAAPTGGEVNDKGDIFSVLLVPGYASYVQYQVFYPSSNGPVPLASVGGYQIGNRIYFPYTGSANKKEVGIGVAANGSLPAGDFCVSDDVFTGTAVVVTPPATTKADAPTVTFDTTSRILSASSQNYGTGELEYRRNGGTVLAYAAIGVDDSAHQADEWQYRVKAATGRTQSDWAGSPYIAAKAAGNQKPSVSFSPVDNSPPTAGTAKQYQALATDQDGTVALVELVLVTSASSQTVTQVLDSDTTQPYLLTWTPAAGTYYLAVRATDNQGASSLSSALAVTVQAATTAPPTNLRTTAITSSTATLAWDAPAGTYTLQRAPVDASGTVGAFATVYAGSTASYQDSGLTYQGKYAYQVAVTVNGVMSGYGTVLVTQAASSSATPTTITPQSSQYWYNKRDEANNGYTRRDALAGFPLKIDQASSGITFRAKTNFDSYYTTNTYITVYKNGSYFAKFAVNQPGTIQSYNLGAVAAGDLLLFREGLQQRPNESGDVQVVDLVDITLPAGSTYSIPAFTPVAECILSGVNSRTVGGGTSNPAQFSHTRVVEDRRGADGYRLGYGAARLANHIGTASLQDAFVAECVARFNASNYTSKWVQLQDPRNDYGTLTPAQVTSLYQQTITKLNAAISGVKILITTSLPISDNTYSSYADAEAAASSGFSNVYVCRSSDYVSTADLADGNHLNDAGEAKLAAGEITTMNGSPYAGTTAPPTTGGNTYETESAAYFTRVTNTGVTLTTAQKDAVNTLWLGFKAKGIAPLLFEFYPMIGGTAASHALGFLNAYSLTWHGNVTHSATGSKGDGTTGYGDTGLVPSAVLTDGTAHLSFYSRTDTGSTPSEREMGVADEASGQRVLRMMFNLGGIARLETLAAGGKGVLAAPASTAGFFLGNRINANGYGAYQNNVSIGGDTAAVTPPPTGSVLVLAQGSETNTVAGFSTKECAFASLGLGLGETRNFTDLVQAYQTALGRQV